MLVLLLLATIHILFFVHAYYSCVILLLLFIPEVHNILRGSAFVEDPIFC